MDAWRLPPEAVWEGVNQNVTVLDRELENDTGVKPRQFVVWAGFDISHGHAILGWGEASVPSMVQTELDLEMGGAVEPF